MFNVGSVFFKKRTDPLPPTPPPATVTGADNGLSLDDTTVELGQDFSAPGDPAALLNNREIPMSGNVLRLLTDNFANQGIGSFRIEGGGSSQLFIGAINQLGGNAPAGGEQTGSGVSNIFSPSGGGGIGFNYNGFVFRDTVAPTGGSAINYNSVWVSPQVFPPAGSTAAGAANGIRVNPQIQGQPGADIAFRAIYVQPTSTNNPAEIIGFFFDGVIGIGNTGHVTAFQNNEGDNFLNVDDGVTLIGTEFATGTGKLEVLKTESGSSAGQAAAIYASWSTTGSPTALRIRATGSAGANALLLDLQQSSFSVFNIGFNGQVKVLAFNTGSSAAAALSIMPTWNTTGSPTALLINPTNTASGASANLIDAQIGGVSQFKVTKAGNVEISTLTSGRIPLIGTNGRLLDMSNIFYGGNFIGIFGYLIAGFNVTNRPTGFSITVNRTRDIYTNDGATAIAVFLLPDTTGGTGSIGVEFTFIVKDADGIRITAFANANIRNAASVTALGGSIESTTIGDVIRLITVSTTEWYVISVVGTGWAVV